MHVRYVLVDDDYFVIIEPDQQKQEDYKVKVHKKILLKNAEALVDRTEPRNLIIGMAQINKNPGGKPQLDELTLFFENTAKCQYVKNLLDLSKKTAKFKLITQVAGFLEKCKADCNLE